jgi:hypothetical protein
MRAAFSPASVRCPDLGSEVFVSTETAGRNSIRHIRNTSNINAAPTTEIRANASADNEHLAPTQTRQRKRVATTENLPRDKIVDRWLGHATRDTRESPSRPPRTQCGFHSVVAAHDVCRIIDRDMRNRNLNAFAQVTRQHRVQLGRRDKAGLKGNGTTASIHTG